MKLGNQAPHTDMDLSQWLDECNAGAAASRWWTPSGLRWRLALMKATEQFSNRLRADAGPMAVCEKCKSAPATCHVAYPPRQAPKFGHYCSACSKTVPKGWMVVTTS